jgi:hypothetical protein
MAILGLFYDFSSLGVGIASAWPRACAYSVGLAILCRSDWQQKKIQTDS